MSSFDINILVNGHRCKQYQHEGKIYVEAKQGSEYCIEIKNNHHKRILAVGSVDSLNVLTGKTATDNDSGYILDAYHSEKIKGFRFSDDEWAMFKFGYKFNGKTYAQSKQDGSEKNCGVIGVQLYYEQEPMWTYTMYQPTWSFGTPVYPYPQPYTVWYSSNTGGNMCNGIGQQVDNMGNITYTCSTGTPHVIQSNFCQVGPVACASAINNSAQDVLIRSNLSNEVKPTNFDMGTEWGKRESSKVHTVSFNRGYLAHSLDIFYASRAALIEMGVPITNKLKTNFPQSFKKGYAVAPIGWQG